MPLQVQVGDRMLVAVMAYDRTGLRRLEFLFLCLLPTGGLQIGFYNENGRWSGLHGFATSETFHDGSRLLTLHFNCCGHVTWLEVDSWTRVGGAGRGI